MQKLGYGEYHEVMNAKKVAIFLKRLPKYQQKLAKVKKTNNDGIVRELIYRIEKYSKLNWFVKKRMTGSVYKVTPISNCSVNSLYLLRIVTSVTPAISATSL